MFKKVLIATDGSSHAQKAVEIGSCLAIRAGAEVHLVHVVLSSELDADLQRMMEIEHLDHALKIAENPAVPLVLAPGYPMAFPITEPMASYRALQALGEEILKRATSAVNAHGIDRVLTHLVDGDAAEEITKLVRSEDPDLVVCGARGLSGLSQLTLGSVSAKVAHSCPVTCVTVH